MGEKRLAAIMFTDIVGYTAMMQTDESIAVLALRRHREAIEKWVPFYGGEVQNFYGDGSLSLFSSMTDALKCARELQKSLQTDDKVPLRVGLHIGEISHEGEKVYGNGVNVASRIEASGYEGTILLSKDAYDKVSNRREFVFENVGQFAFKNVIEPMVLYALVDPALPDVVPDFFSNRLQKHSPWHTQRSVQLGGIAVILLIVAVLAISYYRGTITTEDRMEQVIAVLPFSVKGNPGLDYLSEGMVDLFSTKLEGVPGLSVLDPNIVLSNTKTKSVLDGHPDEIYQEVRTWGASGFLEGSIMQVGDGIRIRISQYQSAEEPASSAEVILKDESMLLSGIDELLRKTIAQTMHRSGQETVALASMTTENISAVKDFLQGESFRRNGQYGLASEAYNHALQYDSTFGMVWLRLVQACAWNGICPFPRNAMLEKVEANMDKFPSKLQQYVQAMLSEMRFAPDAENEFRDLIQMYGQNVDFMVGLGEVLFHQNQRKGRLASEAVPFFEKARAYDNSNIEVREHLVELLAHEERSITLDTIVQSISYDSDKWFAFEAVRLLVSPQTWSDSDLQRILDHPKFNYIQLFNKCHVENLTPRFIKLLEDLERHEGQPIPNVPYGPPISMIIYSWQGREEEAWEAVQQHPLMELSCYVLPLCNMEEELELFSHQLQSQIENLASGGTSGPFPDDFILALLALQKKDTMAYREHYESLSATGSGNGNMDNYLKGVCESLFLREKGKFLQSNDMIDSVLLLPPFPAPPGFFGFVEGALLLARAENEYDQGDYNSALHWYEVRFNIMNGGDEQLLGYSLFRRGQLNGLLDRKQEAINYYDRFLALYQQADAKFDSWVETAKSERERLVVLLN